MAYLASHFNSLHPVVLIRASKFTFVGVNSVMDLSPIQGGVEILLVASCYGKQDKLGSDGSICLFAASSPQQLLSCPQGCPCREV